MKPFFAHSVPHILLLLIAAALVYGAIGQTCPWFFAIAILLFAAWDAGFYFWGEIDDRTGKDVVQAITEAKQSMSYFILLYGALIAVAYAGGDRAKFIDLCKAANIPIWLPLAPLLIAAFAALFVPVQRDNEKKTDAPASDAIKSMLALTVFLQKCAILTFAYWIMIVGIHLSRPDAQPQKADDPPVPAATAIPDASTGAGAVKATDQTSESK